MTVVSVEKDPANRTMTLVAEFDAGVDRVWRVWSDPRQLERWWGPPTYPATVEDHDLVPGGRVTYYMTGPEGDRHRGWWRITAAEAPRRLAFEDGFTDTDGTPSAEQPVTAVEVSLADRSGGGTRMEIRSTFLSTEAMEQLLAMGVAEGFTAAVGQLDAILAETEARRA
ncbi:MAG: SRPBCC domain-containing protein [Actinomycetales bacterium]